MHSENNELAKAGHELAKCLDSNTPLTEIAKLIARLATALDVTTLAVREATKQRDALVAENAALKSYLPQPQGAAMMEALDAFYDREDVPEQGMMAAFEILCCKRPQTPATDAFLREVRAQGVEEFVKRLRDSADIYDKNGRHEWADHNRVVADDGNFFAAELRKGGAA
ncbi:hypothetical protein QLY96_20335 [Cronobacter sakazakii]|uniref:hypothetical protein n=1 Tax=Cronobacter sakazakii TaxID=28141 RepID=UPI00294B09DE|nr:hypothetical protein [Cronobacter sakazakii]MDI7549289.1 hypothetical protein [Cronobacter sakazakii]MDI7611657.1 hypothetical protein [Cronobacter sakazakii]MDI7615167.1 hypothetical protein [Cronobacter sakazakii]MDK1124367.1 hypothetical protein [Cronobacter sakazakii]MDK1268845.1 hypothetical protein [Cronobacter sakazakii]